MARLSAQSQPSLPAEAHVSGLEMPLEPKRDPTRDRAIQIDAPGKRRVVPATNWPQRTATQVGAELPVPGGQPGLLSAAGLLLLWGRGWVEPVVPPPAPAHVVAQQLLALCLQERHVGEHLWTDWWDGLAMSDPPAIRPHATDMEGCARRSRRADVPARRDREVLDGLKFSDALPRHIAEATLARRLADLEGARIALADPFRPLITGRRTARVVGRRRGASDCRTGGLDDSPGHQELGPCLRRCPSAGMPRSRRSARPVARWVRCGVGQLEAAPRVKSDDVHEHLALRVLEFFHHHRHGGDD